MTNYIINSFMGSNPILIGQPTIFIPENGNMQILYAGCISEQPPVQLDLPVSTSGFSVTFPCPGVRVPNQNTGGFPVSLGESPNGAPFQLPQPTDTVVVTLNPDGLLITIEGIMYSGVISIPHPKGTIITNAQNGITISVNAQKPKQIGLRLNKMFTVKTEDDEIVLGASLDPIPAHLEVDKKAVMHLYVNPKSKQMELNVQSKKSRLVIQ